MNIVNYKISELYDIIINISIYTNVYEVDLLEFYIINNIDILLNEISPTLKNETYNISG